MIERTPVLALDSGLMYYPLDRYWRETLDDLIIHFRFAHSLNATERCIPETYLLRVLRMLPEKSYRIDMRHDKVRSTVGEVQTAARWLGKDVSTYQGETRCDGL